MKELIAALTALMELPKTIEEIKSNVVTEDVVREIVSGAVNESVDDLKYNDHFNELVDNSVRECVDERLPDMSEFAKNDELPDFDDFVNSYDMRVEETEVASIGEVEDVQKSVDELERRVDEIEKGKDDGATESVLCANKEDIETMKREFKELTSAIIATRERLTKLRDALTAALEA